LQVVAAHLLRSVNCASWASWSVFLVYWLFCLPFSLALAFPRGFTLFGVPVGWYDLGPTGIWISLATGLTLVALAMTWKFRRVAQAGVAS
jgi:Na+-driven multidrug efflux pump